MLTKEQFAKTLDMTLLRPEATAEEVTRFCEAARAVLPAAVVVYPIWVRRAVKLLAGSGVFVCTVAGFPSGCTMRKAKMKEVEWAVEAGATEIDVVPNLGALKSGDWGEVEKELRDLLETARVAGLSLGAPVVTKVILECGILTNDEKVRAATLCRDLAADFVKTSTGFHPSGGATLEDVRLLRQTVGPTMGVKAAGGIKDVETALAMLEAGATRLGTSAATEMLSSFESSAE